MYPNDSPIPINRDCTACTLACGTSISGRGPDDLSQIKLILVSDYPGAYESEYGWPQVPNHWVTSQLKKQRKLPQPPNSGALIREILQSDFGLDSFTEVWITNALKCDPNSGGRSLKPTDRQLGICSSTWAQAEFARLDEIIPHVPILAAGSWALKLVRSIYRDRCAVGSIDDLLREPNLLAGNHPLICSYNPATYARSFGQIETSVSVNRRSHALEITNVSPLNHFLYTPIEIFKADLADLKQYLT